MNKKYLRITLLIISMIFVVEGITRGEMNKAFIKAINICLECIGIG